MEEPTQKWYQRSALGKVWNKKASIYDRYVTRTRNHSLRHYISKEQELLDEYLEKVIARHPERKISIFEIGSGTGRTLLSYIKKPNILRNVEYLIGIDEAPAMYNISKFKLTEKSAFVNSSKMFDRFIFLNLRAEETAKYFERGHILLEKFLSDNINGCLAKIEERKFNESIKVVIILLNTLGVIKETRQLVLRNMVRIAGTSGRVVVSVFNAAAFRKRAQAIYDSIKNIVGKFNLDDFNFERFEFATGPYYSHWFDRNEVRDMMKKAGCTKTRVESIGDVALFATSEVKK